MCGIIGSFSKEKIVELAKLNSRRGNKTFSFTIMTPTGDVTYQTKEVGTFKEEILESARVKVYDNCRPYYILHIQSPTKITESTQDNIHPAIKTTPGSFLTRKEYLWHNGMLLEKNFKELKKKFHYHSDWDTGLILESVHRDFKNLEELEGSFACLYLKENSLFIFRNQIVPLYVDKDMNISSATFEGGKQIDPNQVYRVSTVMKRIEPVFTFTNKHNPYIL